MSELSGRLRVPVELLELEVDRDESGSTVSSWVSKGMIWAAVEPETPQIREEAGARSARQRYAVTMRRRPLSLRHRLVWNSRAFDVLAVLDDPNHPDRLTLRVQEAHP